MIHQCIGFIHGRSFDPLDAIGRSTLLHGIPQYPCGFLAAGLRGWMESEDDRVSCFNGDQCLEYRRGGRIGYRCYPHDNPDRFCYF